MTNYYLNRRPMFNGHYAVHTENCPFLAEKEKRILLGGFESCRNAVLTARIFTEKANGCLFCSKMCSQPDNELLYRLADSMAE
jgi:hypothetical protein